MSMLEFPSVTLNRRVAVRAEAVTAISEDQGGTCWLYCGEGIGFHLDQRYDKVRHQVFPLESADGDSATRHPTRTGLDRQVLWLDTVPPAPEELGCDPLAFEKLTPITPRTTP